MIKSARRWLLSESKIDAITIEARLYVEKLQKSNPSHRNLASMMKTTTATGTGSYQASLLVLKYGEIEACILTTPMGSYGRLPFRCTPKVQYSVPRELREYLR
jgi:hypothetical protein